MTQQRLCRRLMPVEVGGLLEQRDDAVDAREFHQAIDCQIVQARGHGLTPGAGPSDAQRRSYSRKRRAETILGKASTKRSRRRWPVNRP